MSQYRVVPCPPENMLFGDSNIVISYYRAENSANQNGETMEPPLKRCRPKLLDSVKSPPRKLNATGKITVSVPEAA